MAILIAQHLFKCIVTGMIRPGLHLESDGAAMAFPNLGASRVSVSMPQLLAIEKKNILLGKHEINHHFVLISSYKYKI